MNLIKSFLNLFSTKSIPISIPTRIELPVNPPLISDFKVIHSNAIEQIIYFASTPEIASNMNKYGDVYPLDRPESYCVHVHPRVDYFRLIAELEKLSGITVNQWDE